jgi:hypothetical protein
MTVPILHLHLKLTFRGDGLNRPVTHRLSSAVKCVYNAVKPAIFYRTSEQITDLDIRQISYGLQVHMWGLRHLHTEVRETTGRLRSGTYSEMGDEEGQCR